ncbi:hypothetical protein [Brasilonema bromeliae]|uniref:Mannosyltransferase n=1 Tax=Brasilonema bromeliae SPC951 TaxID=385972 RepID=A0ABX1P5M3_9CYAN|nr:hypothetical protein [Brasilonema bromeliae]NMG19373.1 hypothetical protein [Brasilonema bromeliae SPC951]
MIKHISHRIFITVFILIALHATPDGPQTSRYTDAIHSFVNFGTFALQKGYRSHIDILLLNNNAYSVIPPGIPIILAPLYFIHQMLMRLIGIPEGEVYWAIFNILSNVCVSAPLLGIVAVIMFKTLDYFTNDLVKKLWVVFIFIFGSLVFFYSTNGIWSHVYTMSFIFLAFYLIINQANSFFIGLFLGLAQMVDYIAIVPISLLIGFWIYLRIQEKDNKSLLTNIFLLLLGYSIFLGVIMFYNQTITGSVFKTPNSLFLKQLNQEDTIQKSMFIVPSLGTIWSLTFSSFRGIFLYFPMTILFLGSFVKKTYQKNNVILFCFIFFAFIFVLNASYYAWSGDVCFGPRHLVVATPFILLPVVYSPLKYIKLLGVLSMFINLAGVSTIPSNNLLINIVMFLYRGPFLHWQDYLYKVVLPQYYNVRLSLMTPFFIYVATGFLIYLIWKPGINQEEVLLKDKLVS